MLANFVCMNRVISGVSLLMSQHLHPCAVIVCRFVLICKIPRLKEVFGIRLATLEYDGLLVPSWTTPLPILLS